MIAKGQSQPLPPESHFDRYTTKEGLPGNNILTLIQDDQGFLWIGTDAGLSCFDGVHFTNYYKGDDPRNSLPSNFIVQMAKLPNGHLVIATRFGLSLLDPVRRSFRSALIPHEPGMEFVQNAVGAFVLTNRGHIVAGSNAGICVFDTALNVVFQYAHFKKEDLNKIYMGFAHDMMALDNGDVLIRGSDGFWRYNAAKSRIEKQKATAFGEPDWRIFHSSGKAGVTIWRAAFPDTLSIGNVYTRKASTTKLSDEMKYEFHWRTTLRFVNDSLLGFAGNNYGFRTAICDSSTLQLRFSNTRIFPDQHFNTFLFDREGRWWLASENGLFGQSFSKGMFRFVPLTLGTGSDNIPFTITGMTKADGRFYLGLFSKILVFDKSLRLQNAIDYPPQYVHIWGLTQWHPGMLEVWSSSGWKRLPIQKDWSKPPDWQPTGTSQGIRSQLMDSRGDIWSGTWAGVLRCNPNTGQSTHYDDNDPDSKFPFQGALKIIETDSGYLWMCGIPGFTHWNPYTQSFDRHFKRAPGTEGQEGFPSSMVSCGGEEVLFSLYNNGLWRWQGDERPARKVATGNPAFEFVNDIFPDPRPQHFWLLLKSGIALLDISRWKYRYLTPNEGLPDETTKAQKPHCACL